MSRAIEFAAVPRLLPLLALAVACGSNSPQGNEPGPDRIAVSPSATTLPVNDSQKFVAAPVTGSGVLKISWSVLEPGGGVIDISGTYVAPATPGTFHVVATSEASPSVKGNAQVLVQSLPSGTGTIVPAGNVSGRWTLGGSPYLIKGNIVVPSGTTLTIDPGVRVEFQGPYSMRCFGGITAVGTATQRIQFTTTTADAAKPNYTWTGWRGLRISGSHEYPPVHDSGPGLFNLQYCEISYVDKAQNGAFTNYDPHEEWNGNFHATDVIPGDLIFNNNWVHHAKASTATGGGVLFWVSHLSGSSVPNTVADYYFYDNVFEDSQWNGVYFAHNSRADGSVVTAHLVRGAIRRTQRQALGTASVCTVFATSASLDGVEITDSGDRFATPWFSVAAAPGGITYTAP